MNGRGDAQPLSLGHANVSSTRAMILDALSFFSRSKPQAIAMIDRSAGEMTYQQVERAVIGLAVALLTDLPDLPRMQPVAVACADKRLHLLLTFALEALGVATLGFVQPIDPGLVGALKQCKMLIADEPLLAMPLPFFELSRTWLERAIASPIEPSFRSAVWGPDGIVSVLTTSGSTGNMKSIGLHRSAFDAREANRIWQYGLTAQSRYLVAMPVSVGIVAMVTRAVLRVGGSLVFWDGENALIGALGITHTTLLPAHVQTFLLTTPLEFVPRQLLKLFSTGAPLGPALRDRAVARLGAEVKNSYGTNETGTCAWFDAKGEGEVLPGVDVQIVDQMRKPLPRGVPGTMRIRSAELARGYLDSKLSRERFTDGWFLTDDVGVMRGPRQLRLVGRADTIINIGGTKLLPEEIEDLLNMRALGRDLAVCTLPNKDGLDELYISVVDAAHEPERMMELVRASLGPNFGHIRIVGAEQVPRNAQGKIQRKALREQVAATVKRAQ